MTVYSKLFAQGFLASGTAVVYTVPNDGATYILRDVVLGAHDVGSTSAVLYDTTDPYILGITGATQFKSFEWHGRQVLVPAGSVSLDCLAGGWTYRLSGYRLVP